MARPEKRVLNESNRADFQESIADRQRWYLKDMQFRQRHAKDMCLTISKQCVWVSTDPFALLRIYNRLVNCTEHPEGIGFKQVGAQYTLIHSDHVQAL